MLRLKFPSVYDLVMVPADWVGLRRHRRAIVAGADGRVLEVAAGTGLNLRHYRRADSVTAVDLSREMVERISARTPPGDLRSFTATAAAEALPFADDLFDTVVLTLSLCTIHDAAQAVDEIKRVLKPGGSFRFLEHTLHRRRWIRALQRSFTPSWKKVAGGCHLDRATVETIEQAGFEVSWSRRSGFGWLTLGVGVVTGHPGS
jgi:ubiquinone/menaquinone biosynthesis C-methylase UbiE